MISKKFKVLEVKDGQGYVFDSFAFKTSVRNYVANKKSAGEHFSIEKAKVELANVVCISIDSITNWMYGRNGVADLESLKKIAEYLDVDYTQMLRVEEEKKMVDNNIVSEVNMDKTKDVLRSVYQKMAIFMDIAARCVRFDYSREFFDEYEHYYLEAERVLHLSLLDIPVSIYNKLNDVLSELKVYMYGLEGEPLDLWDTTEYQDFLDEREEEDSDDAEMRFMKRKSVEFYEKMQEILKDYITV